jgi:monovalent cation:H+ antiporter-2, CPA2 family
MMLLVAGLCILVMSRLKMPTIIGYLLAGVLLGPNLFPQYILSQDIVSIFSSMGIVLLMFFIGIELNLRGLRKVASFALVVVSVEMTIMILIGFYLGLAFNFDPSQAIFLGIVMSCASTAAVLTIIPNSRYLAGEDRRTITGILIMEDLGLIIILTILGPAIIGESNAFGSILGLIIGIGVFIAMTIILGIAVIPKMLDRIRSHSSDEVLFLTSLAMAFAMAWISSAIGLSVAVGAFLMGIIVSESESSRTVITKVEPMKELFIATFFISIGYQFDPRLFVQVAVIAIIIAVVFILAKMLSVTFACYMANYKARSCLLIGASLVAMGEFSFVVAKLALDNGLIDGLLYSAVIGAAIISLIAYPFISRGSPRLFDWIIRRMPVKIQQDLTKYEGARAEFRVKTSLSPQIRNEVRKELMLIVIDMVLIICIIIAVNLLSILNALAESLGAGLGILSEIVTFLLGLILTLPLIFILVTRIKKLSRVLASALREDGRYRMRQGAAGKVFKNLSEALLAFIIFLVFLPFLPRVASLNFLPLLAIGFIAILISYLIWDAYKAVYRRITSSIVSGIQKEDDQEMD